MGQCLKCVKYILFVLNFCLWLLGCALLSVGIWMKTDDIADHHVQQMTDKTDENYQISYSAMGGGDATVTIAYLLIVLGSILIIVTFIGCFGAVRENMCMLGTFAACLFVLMVALLSVGAWVYTRKDDIDVYTVDLRNKTDTNLARGIRMYYSDEVSKMFMDNVQKRFRCCGSEKSISDYSIHGRVPDSCLPENYARGCSYYYYWYVGDEIQQFLQERYKILSGVSIGVALCLGVGMAFSILLCILVRRATRLVVH